LDHLFLGSAQANTIDMHSKGRGRSKLTPELVRKIREEYAAGGIKQSDIAKRLDVKEACIQRLIAGRSWKSVA
jgi:ribosome-binding protein aMBF1 (putative translation factor)